MKDMLEAHIHTEQSPAQELGIYYHLLVLFFSGRIDGQLGLLSVEIPWTQYDFERDFYEGPAHPCAPSLRYWPGRAALVAPIRTMLSDSPSYILGTGTLHGYAPLPEFPF